MSKLSQFHKITISKESISDDEDDAIEMDISCSFVTNYNNNNNNFEYMDNDKWSEYFNFYFKINTLATFNNQANTLPQEFLIDYKLGDIQYFKNGKIITAYHSVVRPKIIFKDNVYNDMKDWLKKCFHLNC